MTRKLSPGGTFALIPALVFGLALTACGSPPTEVTVANHGPATGPGYGVVTVEIFVGGSGYSLTTGENRISPGQAAFFQMNAGHYTIVVTDADGSRFTFPRTANETGAYFMSGFFLLRFDGNDLRRVH